MKKSVITGAVLLAVAIPTCAQATQQCIGGPGTYGGVTVTVNCDGESGSFAFNQSNAGFNQTLAIYKIQTCIFDFSSAVGSLSTAIIALDNSDGPMSYKLNNTTFTAQPSDLDGVSTPPTRTNGCIAPLSVEAGNVVNMGEGCGSAILNFTGQTNVTSLSIQGGGTFNAVCFSPLLQPQTLTLAPATASVAIGVGQNLTLTGVMGTGLVTYSVDGSGGVSCAISNNSASGATVTGTGGTGTCSVTAAIAADATYAAATSNMAVVTITGNPYDVPVLGLWGMVTLVLSLGAAAGRRLRRRGGMPRV